MNHSLFGNDVPSPGGDPDHPARLPSLLSLAWGKPAGLSQGGGSGPGGSVRQPPGAPPAHPGGVRGVPGPAVPAEGGAGPAPRAEPPRTAPRIPLLRPAASCPCSVPFLSRSRPLLTRSVRILSELRSRSVPAPSSLHPRSVFLHPRSIPSPFPLCPALSRSIPAPSRLCPAPCRGDGPALGAAVVPGLPGRHPGLLRRALPLPVEELLPLLPGASGVPRPAARYVRDQVAWEGPFRARLWSDSVPGALPRGVCPQVPQLLVEVPGWRPPK